MLNPKKWNVFCWVLLLVWLLPSIGGNLPYSPEFDGPSSLELPDGGTAVAYGQVYLIGFPLTYLEISRPANTLVSNKTFYLVHLLLNGSLVLLTLFGIIYCVQTFMPQFSIISLLVAVTCVAVLVSIGNIVLASQNYTLYFGFIFAIYFSPLVLMLSMFAYSKYEQKARIAG